MKCNINDVVFKELEILTDDRGWLIELFRTDEINPEFPPEMCYVSVTKSGVTRGPHEHRDQADHFCFIGASTFRMYLWDNRSSSSTYGEKYQIDVGENKPTAIIVPKGIVHAYKNIGNQDRVVFNAPINYMLVLIVLRKLLKSDMKIMSNQYFKLRIRKHQIYYHIFTI